MTIQLTNLFIIAVLSIQICWSSPLFFSSSSPTESSHIQLAKQTNGQPPCPAPDESETHLFSQLLSEFSILAVEFFLQIVGIGVGAFNVIKDSISQTFFRPGNE